MKTHPHRTLKVPQSAAALGLRLATLTGTAASAGPALDRVRANGMVKACIWRDCYGLTFHSRRDGQLRSIDTHLSVALARDLQQAACRNGLAEIVVH
jgi:hypothetical protein